MKLLIFFLVGIVLFLLFRMIRAIAPPLLSRGWFKQLLNRFFPVFELVVWLIYAFWGTSWFFGEAPWYHVVAASMGVLLVAGIAWFVFRDMFEGMLLRADTGLEKGQYIRTALAEGVIEKVGLRSVFLVNGQGESIRIPYAALAKQIILIQPAEEQMRPHHVHIELGSSMNPSNARDEARLLLVSLPWITEPMPEVGVEKNKETGRFTLYAKFHTHAKEDALIVEEKLIQAFSQESVKTTAKKKTGL